MKIQLSGNMFCITLLTKVKDNKSTSAVKEYLVERGDIIYNNTAIKNVI